MKTKYSHHRFEFNFKVKKRPHQSHNLDIVFHLLSLCIQSILPPGDARNICFKLHSNAKVQQKYLTRTENNTADFLQTSENKDTRQRISARYSRPTYRKVSADQEHLQNFCHIHFPSDADRQTRTRKPPIPRQRKRQ
jgi:hypothetical protein